MENRLSSTIPQGENRIRGRDVWLLIGVNVILRGLWLAYMHPPQTSDFLYYYQHAVQLYHGFGYTVHGHPTAYRPMGYPFFLSLLFHLTGPHVWAGLIAQAVLSTTMVLLVYGLTLTLLANRTAALAAALGYTLLPSQIAWNSVLGTEELCTCLVAASLFVYLRFGRRHIGWIAVAGVAMGFGCDVREVVAFFPVFLLILEIWLQPHQWRQSLLRVLVFAACMAAAIAPVTIRNALVMHHFILVSLNGGQNLWQGIHTNGGYYWSNNPKVNPVLYGGNNEYLGEQYGVHEFLQYAMQHPWRVFMNGFKKMGDLYRFDHNVFYWFHAVRMPGWSGVLYIAAQYISTWIYRLWMVIALVGAAVCLRMPSVDRRCRAVLALYIGYNTVIMSVFPAWDRFRMPMMPEWAVLFGIGLWWMGSGRRFGFGETVRKAR